MARQTSGPGARATAGMAWARDGFQGPGIFSEVGDHDPEIKQQVVTADPSSSQYTTAVILAAFGQSEPLL